MLEESTESQKNSIDIDIGMAVNRVDSWVDGFITLLPNILVAGLLLLIMYGVSRLVASLIARHFRHRKRDNLGSALAGSVKWTMLFIAVLLAATIVFPSLKPADLIAGLGISSVAIGFAFKDILQNWLAGLLILIRQPFEVGDQIMVNDFEGTVERIETRATLIKTYNAQRVVIPNSDIYTNAVLVKTAHDVRRSQYDIGIGYGDNIDQAKTAIKRAVQAIEGVEQEPGVQAMVWDLAASWITIRTRWWTDSRRSDIIRVRSDVIEAIKYALDDQRIDMPFETQVHLFHDQTEDSDGDREAQREGWPAPSDGTTTPRWRAKEKKKTNQKKDDQSNVSEFKPA